MKIGEIVRQYRKEHKITMESFAKKAKVSKGYISMLEKGKNPKTDKPITPTLETLKNLADAMNVDFNLLLNQIDSDQAIRMNVGKTGAIHQVIENVPFYESESSIVNTIKEIATKLIPSRQELVLSFVKNQLDKQESSTIISESEPEYNSDKVTELSDYREYRSERLSGILSAGRGIWQEEDLDMEISFPVDEIPDNKEYDSLAKVVGESMRPKFHDGDILFIKHTNQVELGEIAAFKVDGENFVKKFKKDNIGRYYLESLNDDYDDIFFDEDTTVETIGIVVDYWRE